MTETNNQLSKKLVVNFQLIGCAQRTLTASFLSLQPQFDSCEEKQKNGQDHRCVYDCERSRHVCTWRNSPEKIFYGYNLFPFWNCRSSFHPLAESSTGGQRGKQRFERLELEVEDRVRLLCPLWTTGSSHRQTVCVLWVNKCFLQRAPETSRNTPFYPQITRNVCGSDTSSIIH